jgi:hypothetical protein
VFLFFFVCLPFWSKVRCDTGWYVVPVQITKTDSTIQLGFLPLFETEIVGIEVGTNIKTEVAIQGEKIGLPIISVRPIVEGRIHPETLRLDTVKWIPIGYDFGEIEILEVTDKGLRIRITKESFFLELKDVHHFIFDGMQTLPLASRVWTSHTDFFYREEREEIPITEVRKIKAIGEVVFVPGNWGD